MKKIQLDLLQTVSSPLIVMVILVLWGCEEQIDWKTDNEALPLVVVEAVITNEKTNHLVRLTRPTQVSNEVPQPISSAFVAIVEGSNVELLTEFPANSGNYYTTANFQALFDKTYLLYIQHAGQEFQAIESAAAGEPLPPFLALPADSLLYRMEFSGTNRPSMTRHILDWSNSAYCQSVNNGLECFAKVVYYDLQTIDVNEQYKPEKEDVQFPSGTVILRKKYSLSPGYHAFLRSLLSETEWRGGLFDVQRGNLITNLSEGAVGYFAVSTVVSDTIIFNP